MKTAKFLTREWTSAELACLRAHAGTHTATQISALMGTRTRRAIYHMARRISVNLRKFGKYNHSTIYPDATVRHAFELRCQGATAAAISEELGVPKGTVLQWIGGYYRYAAVAP